MATVQYAPSRAAESAREERASSAFFALACIGLGFLVVALAFFAALMWSDANGARNAADRAAAKAGSAQSMAMPMPADTAASDLKSYAGSGPANAEALAAAHRAFPAELPAAPAGDVADVKLVLKDVEIQVAPGIKYSAWAFSGGAPGPVIHVRQGQTVKQTRPELVLALDGGKIVNQTTTRVQGDEGHIHLYVDGKLVAMNYGLRQRLPQLPPGQHVVQVEFVAADHAPFDPRVLTQAAFEVAG